MSTSKSYPPDDSGGTGAGKAAAGPHSSGPSPAHAGADIPAGAPPKGSGLAAPMMATPMMAGPMMGGPKPGAPGSAPPGSAPPGSAPPGAMMSGAGPDDMGEMAGAPEMMMPKGGNISVPYGRLVRFSWVLVKPSLAVLAGVVAISVFVQLLTQYNTQILSTITSLLARSGPGTAASAGPGQGGLLDLLLPTTVQGAAIVFAVSAVVLILMIFGERVYNAWADNLMTTRLQQRMHDKLLRVGPSFHKDHDVSETTVTVTAFANGAQQVASDLISFPVVRGITMATAIIFLVYNLQSLKGAPVWMQYVLIGAVILLPMVGWWFSRGIVKTAHHMVERQMDLSNEFMNSASNPNEIRLMGAERQRATAFARSLAGLRAAAVAAAIRRELGTQFQAAVPRILSAVFLLYGIFFAYQSGDPAAVGAIVAFVLFIPQAVNPLNELLAFFIGVSASWPQVEKVVEIAEAAEEAEASGAKPLAKEGPSAIAFENVAFSYAPDLPKVLDGIDHVFGDGKITAIVARAGAGKSTILNLVARQFRPQQGRITLGGDDVANATTESLRDVVVKVSQFPAFMVDTVRANFRLAKEDATDAEIEAVCRRTGLWAVLERKMQPGRSPLDLELPRKLENELSGGQQRLFAVTRGLLRKPRVLLIDEPTTGIDPIGISELGKFLRPACLGVTTLVVDHRMSFVNQFADVVCCLENGRFTDVGSPGELDRPGTLFHQLKELERSEPASGAPGGVPIVETLDFPPGAFPEGALKKEKGAASRATLVDPSELPGIGELDMDEMEIDAPPMAKPGNPGSAGDPGPKKGHGAGPPGMIEGDPFETKPKRS